MPEYHIPKDPNCFGDVSVQFFDVFLVGETHGNCCTSMTSSNHYVSDYLTASRPLLHRQISQICIVNILPTSKLIICKNLWEFLDFWIGYWIYTSHHISKYLRTYLGNLDQCITSKFQKNGVPTWDPKMRRWTSESWAKKSSILKQWTFLYGRPGLLRRREVIMEVTDFEPLAYWTCFSYLSWYSSIWGVTMRDEWVVILVIIGKSAVLEAVGGG